jgi:hypothetical protein
MTVGRYWGGERREVLMRIVGGIHREAQGCWLLVDLMASCGEFGELLW